MGVRYFDDGGDVTYNAGDENVFDPGTTYNPGDENVFDPSTAQTYTRYDGTTTTDVNDPNIDWYGNTATREPMVDTKGNPIEGGWVTKLADGSTKYEDPDGSVYYKNANNTYSITGAGGQTLTYDPAKSAFVDASGKALADQSAGSGVLNKLLNAIKSNPVAAIGTGLAAYQKLFGGATTPGGGYNVPVPKLEAVRQAVPYADTTRVPGSSGRQYFTDVQYIPAGDVAARVAANTAANTQINNLQALNAARNPAPTSDSTTGLAHGGIAAARGRYLQGDTDGMADALPSSIDGKEPAALSHGEFVIPADVVSHLGNGNSEAGAKKLYSMMDKIRMARTGTKQQGKQINPDKFMPGGLAAAYAAGGAVKGFEAGGNVVTNQTSAVTGTPLNTTAASGLSPWVGDYVTNMLGQGQALANAPYQAYTGPLTAGPSALQEKTFAGLQNVNFPSNLGKSFTNMGAPTAGTATSPGIASGTGGVAAEYMNPYIQNVLQPQLAELNRQSQIQGLTNAAKATQGGAFGGSRAALMDAETQRNLLNAQNTAIGTAYSNAFDKGQQQFNTEQTQAKTLADLMAAQGAAQRNITSEGVAADLAQYQQQQEYPFKMVDFQSKLLNGLPIGTQTNTTTQDPLSSALSTTAGLASLYKTLSNLIPSSTTSGTTP